MPKRMSSLKNEDLEEMDMMSLIKQVKSKSRHSREDSVEENTKEFTRVALKPLLEVSEAQVEQRQQMFTTFFNDVIALKDKEEEEVPPKNEDEMLKAKNLMKRFQHLKMARSQNIDALKKMSEEMFQKFEACDHAHMEQVDEMLHNRNADSSYDDIFQAVLSEK